MHHQVTVNFIPTVLERKDRIYCFHFVEDFVGYLINAVTAIKTNISVYIGDILDRNEAIFVDNCTQLICEPNGVKKEKVPCQSK